MSKLDEILQNMGMWEIYKGEPMPKISDPKQSIKDLFLELIDECALRKLPADDEYWLKERSIRKKVEEL